MPHTSFVDGIEEAYRPGADAGAWLANVIDRLRPGLDRGGGVFGWFYDAKDYRAIAFTHVTIRGTDPALLQAIVAAHQHPSTTLEMTRRHYATPAGPFSRSLGDAFAGFTGWQRHVVPTGVRDLIVLNAIDPDRRGCAVIAPRAQVRSISPARLALLSRVSAHVSAGQRLLRAGARPADEAVLAPDGKIEDAVGPARSRSQRDALSAAAKAMDRARGRMRRLDPEESIRTWRALVNGRWTLVDRMDSDGRRYVVARVNAPPAPRATRLTERERQVAGWAALGHTNKLIAYELGLPPSTVAWHLEKALQKLGLRRAVELSRVFSGERAGPDEFAP